MNNTFRPPAVPLVTVDPFFSIWSFSDTLAGDVTRHWTGQPHALLGLARIDGQPYRFLGLETEDRSRPVGELPAMEQTGLEVRATQTRYAFAGSGVRLEVSFMAPLLPDDLMLSSRPVNYLVISAVSTDGKTHRVELYLDIGGDLCADNPGQASFKGQPAPFGGLRGVGLQQQEPGTPLAKSGDNQRIDWGTAYLLTTAPAAQAVVASDQVRLVFGQTGSLDLSLADNLKPRPRPTENLIGAVSCLLETGPDTAAEPAVFLLAYDDIVSIDYFGRPTPAYCFKDGASFAEIIAMARDAYPLLKARCDAFDEQLWADCERAGGAAYASLASLAYRQAFAAHKLIADEDGQAVFLSKECFSNGCIGTVDVSYPSIPLFLVYQPELVRGMMRPIFRFAASEAWPYDFAPHDVGQYPRATGQVYGLREGELFLDKQMPVEECGNMLIMMAAACRADGDLSLARRHLEQLGKWAGYLRQYGQDPGEQLCTDDFAGHLAHNANLAVKAIVGLGAYAWLLEQCGRPSEAEATRREALAMARTWQQMANDGDHTRLTFDGEGTWSMKYNLLFDHLLELNLFDQVRVEQDLRFWLDQQNRYGLPLDSRASYTKADWLVWCAALSDDPVQVRRLIQPLWRFYHESGSRVPMTDWYDTISGRAIHFRNRTVMGGLFALLLKARWLRP